MASRLGYSQSYDSKAFVLVSKTSVKIDGLSDLESSFAELGKANTRNALKRALIAAAQSMQNDAQAYAPKNTGFLKNEIITSGRSKYSNPGKKAYANAMHRGDSKEAARAAARAANRNSDKSFAEIYVGPTTKAAYSVPQEFGTKDMPAHPFMRPAWDKNKEPMLDNLTKHLQESLAKALTRVRKKAAKAR